MEIASPGSEGDALGGVFKHSRTAAPFWGQSTQSPSIVFSKIGTAVLKRVNISVQKKMNEFPLERKEYIMGSLRKKPDASAVGRGDKVTDTIRKTRYRFKQE